MPQLHYIYFYISCLCPQILRVLVCRSLIYLRSAKTGRAEAASTIYPHELSEMAPAQLFHALARSSSWVPLRTRVRAATPSGFRNVMRACVEPSHLLIAGLSGKLASYQSPSCRRNNAFYCSYSCYSGALCYLSSLFTAQ